MTTTEVTLIIMDDLLLLMKDREESLYVELAKNFEEPKLGAIKNGSKLAFDIMRIAMENMKGMAMCAQQVNQGIGQA